MRSAAGIDELAAPHVGVVTAIEEFARYADEPPMVGYNCALADTRPVLGRAVDAGAGSLGYDRDSARRAALGEAAERYSAAWVPTVRVVHATQRELGSAAVELARLRMFTQGQKGRPGFRAALVDEHDRLGWVAGRDLATGDERFAPAQLVYLGYAPRRGEPWMGPTTSSGLACGTDDDAATLAALFEAVERDAFMLAWRRRLRAPRLDISGSSLAELHDRYFARARATYDALDLSAVSGIPTVLCVVRDPAGGVGLAVGAATGWSIGHAWTRALAEGFQTYSWARQLVASGASAALRSLDDVESFVDHVAWYADPRRSHPRDRLQPDGWLPLSGSSPPLPGADPVERLAGAVARLDQIGQQVLAFDVTSPDIADLGLCVVRVLGPDLCWLDQGSTYPYLGRPRLADPTAVPASLGGRLVIDPDPHPFP